MGKIKLSLLRFLVSKSGSLLTPIIAGFVATLVAKVAAFDANLAGQLDQSAIVGFIVAAILAAVNYATNSVQTDGIKRIQALVNTDQDGIPGPVTYTEVRRAIPRGQVNREQFAATFSPKPPQDSRPFWRRLLSSLRVQLRPGKSPRKPVSYVGIKGGAEF